MTFNMAFKYVFLDFFSFLSLYISFIRHLGGLLLRHRLHTQILITEFQIPHFRFSSVTYLQFLDIPLVNVFVIVQVLDFSQLYKLLFFYFCLAYRKNY